MLIVVTLFKSIARHVYSVNISPPLESEETLKSPNAPKKELSSRRFAPVPH